MVEKLDVKPSWEERKVVQERALVENHLIQQNLFAALAATFHALKCALDMEPTTWNTNVATVAQWPSSSALAPLTFATRATKTSDMSRKCRGMPYQSALPVSPIRPLLLFLTSFEIRFLYI